MPPTASDEAHQELLASLDILSKPRSFRNPAWKPSSRRNKTVKQIIAEANRREAASTLATKDNSGANTPVPNGGLLGVGNANGQTGLSGAATPVGQAAQSLSTLVLEKNLQARLAAEARASSSATTDGGAGGSETNPANANNSNATPGLMGSLVTYTSLEAAPSLHPAHARPYCDITGLPAPYRDPKTRLRYHNAEVFQYIRGLPQGVAEMHLAARGANVVLK